MKTKIFWICLLIIVSMVLSACSSDETTSTSSKGETDANKQHITMNLGSNPPSLDPARATDTTSGWVIEHVSEGLMSRDEQGNVVKGTASSLEVSEDGKIYTITIREDAKWSDGDPVTANDFEFSWKRVLNPETGSGFAHFLYYIAGAEAFNTNSGSVDDVGIYAEDDYTLIVHLENPTGYFDELLTMWTYFPVKKDIVEGNANWASEVETYVTNGPYTLDSWRHDSELVVKKNEFYWNKDDVNMETINWKMINEASTYYQMYKSGELDIISDLPIDVIDGERGNNDFSIKPYFGTQMFIFNTNEKPFTNQKVRKAFNLAIDRESITEYILRAGEKPATGFVPHGITTPTGEDFRGRNTYVKEDVERARQLIEEAMEEEGWNEFPEVTLMYNTGNANRVLSEGVQEMISQNLDISVRLANQEWSTYLDTLTQRNYQMARMGWIGLFQDPVIILDYFLGDSPLNRTEWNNEEYDRLLAESKAEPDEERRFELLEKAEAILLEDLPFMPVNHYSKTYLTAEYIEDMVYPVNRFPNARWAVRTAK